MKGDFFLIRSPSITQKVPCLFEAVMDNEISKLYNRSDNEESEYYYNLNDKSAKIVIEMIKLLKLVA